MKLFCVLLLTLFFCGNAFCTSEDLENLGDIEPYAMEGMINQTIQQVIKSLPDPINIDATIPLNFDSTLINGSLEVSDPSIAGIQGLLVPELHFNITGFKLNFTFVIPTLKIDSQYLIDSNLLTILPVYGNGSLSIVLDDLKLTGYLELKTKDQIHIENFRIQIGLGSLEINIEGLMYDEEYSKFASFLITKLANTFIISYLDTNADAISDAISPSIEKIINDLLAGGGDTTSSDSPTTTTASTTSKPETTTKAVNLLINALPGIF